jgi:E3 ubiquitin-protein ligase RNF19A
MSLNKSTLLVSLCRAGCGVSTTRDGVKFEFDEDEEVGRNHDAQSVDAVSRIGATSIGEVSLSVASGSHLGGANNAAVRESTTALAGSINGSSAGHKLEVQADISETASAVTCVSHDTASTKALAGSILNYKQTNYDQAASLGEDATSERVRFDNMIYVLDGQRDGDCWYTAPLDQVSCYLMIILNNFVINLFFRIWVQTKQA